MRLKKLKVSGFKSFVDQTDIRLPGRLVGVVGPNGCGKSNVIDAVRWVMGESSAKMLRGDNMADVIFNGSSSRKPVGKASVELIFDNNEGKAGGSYGQFAEISIKRTLTRDGQSNYSINNIKSRRKDVLDLFRGTGLGPRSYSIIEQGMVSRIVEAKPEELRIFVEEAAGTSKYKDRRRETELRIQHTRDNLLRVQDVCDELDKQLRRLKRQSGAARRYKVLKEEERLVNGQLQILKLQGLESQLEEQDRLAAHNENTLQSALSAQRNTEAELERLRQHQTERQEANSQVQQQFYSVGAEIKNIEQRIDHLKETRQRQSEEIERLQSGRTERERELQSDQRRLAQYEQDIAELVPELEGSEQELKAAEEKLSAVEQGLQRWQQEWDGFNQHAQEPVKQKEVQRSRINQLENHLQQTNQRQERMQGELDGFQQLIATMDISNLRERVSNHDRNLEEKETTFLKTEQEIQSTRETITTKRDQLSEHKGKHQNLSSRLSSLKQIQDATLGGDDQALKEWLDNRNIDTSAHLAKRISVEQGWERAADRVLNGFISALCVESNNIHDASQSPNSAVALFTRQSTKALPSHLSYEKLSDKVSADGIDLNSILADFYLADNIEQALARQRELFGRDCIITRDGTLVGANWISYASESQMETGVLVREEEIKQLTQEVEHLSPQLESLEAEISSIVDRRSSLEAALNQQKTTLNQLRAEKTSLHNQIGREETRLLEAEQRSKQVTGDLEELVHQVQADHEQIESAKELLNAAEKQSVDLESKRDQLLSYREGHQQSIASNRTIVSEIRDRRYQKQMQKNRIESAIESVKQNLVRIQQQFDSANQRLGEINSSLTESGNPVNDLQTQLSELIEQRVEAEKNFTAARDEMSGIENQITTLNQNRNREQSEVNESREALEQRKLQKQEVAVRTQTQVETVEEQGYERVAVVAEMPEEANTSEWQQNIEDIQRKIDNIGPVNLVAIDEFEEESTRKEYLDQQIADLTEALETLESVINKIDRETRSRFRETFDKLNAGFQDFFPQLFGGGKAELQLTSDDLLTTGVAVMARPPGKRNSTIHLLSGGEKALTAVALLFSLFKLNPAPFCMLDEVDAPLDDANVDRYCKTLRQLCEISQIVVITHNKITMESADLLVGVTMSEPGVSRLVSVDIDEAVEMAAQ